MARTKQQARKSTSFRMDLNEWSSFQKTPSYPFIIQSEQKIRKYYPKRSKLFFKGLLHQHQNQGLSMMANPKISILQRYSRDFLKSFEANWTRKNSQPAKIPQNLEYLTILGGSQIFIKKVISQNKRLKHINIACFDSNLSRIIVKYLKYLKGVCSISFANQGFALIPDKICKRMLKTWASTLQRVKICGTICKEYLLEPKELSKIIGCLLQFPKLKKIEFKAQNEGIAEFFPFEKLHELKERNISSHASLQLYPQIPEFFTDQTPKFSQGSYLGVEMRSFWERAKLIWDPIEGEKRKKIKLSKHVFNLDLSELDTFCLLELFAAFQDISALELILSSRKWDEADFSNIGQLRNLKHLSLDIDQGDEEANLEDLFLNLCENIKRQKKLETLLMRLSCPSGFDDEEAERIVDFFNACSETLRRAYLNLQYRGEDLMDMQPFYEGLSRLHHLQCLNLSLSARFSGFEEQIEEICQMISRKKSLEELDLKIEKKKYDEEETLNLVLPTQLKQLALRMDTSFVAFDPSTTLWPLTDLIRLELEFVDFDSPKWSKVLQDLDQFKKLEIFILRETKRTMIGSFSSQIKRMLDYLMKKNLSLKLIIIFNQSSSSSMIFKRGYAWSEINKITDEFSLERNIGIKLNYIKNY